MITMAEAAKALAYSLAEVAEPINGAYFITAAAPEQASDELTVYMVGFIGNDPEETDEEGDPTGFMMGPDGNVLCTGPVF
jgi:hypothetical protein